MSPLIAIFAHPDDEVFGPGGTLAKLTHEREIYVICVTDGDAGLNSSTKTKSLGEIRKEEMLASTQIIGIKKVFFLGYKDGTLSNNFYHEIAEKIQKIIEDIKPDTLMTFEPRGVSGHIDHIAVSMISSYVFEHTDFVKELWYYCLTETARKYYEPYFIYFPPGYKESEIDKIVDISSVWEKKIDAMHQHESQKHDIKKLLGVFQKRKKEEYFMILKK
jgi:LmbE family N-acetylglucosaminyl deacetylase